jgi:hypothetical protein
MPDYIECALARLSHPIPEKPQHQPLNSFTASGAYIMRQLINQAL